MAGTGKRPEEKMHIVAIHSLTKDKEVMAGTLAAALGVTMYEALARVRAPGNGPLTVCVFAEMGRAGQLAERLQTAGFKAVVLTGDEIETEGHARIVRLFSLGEESLDVKSEKGESLSIPFQNVDLMLRGTMIVRDVSTTETVKSRSVSPGRAVLSGGLVLTKKTETVREVTSEARQGFVALYAGDRATLIFREKTLVYDSLGPALRASRAENFAYLIAELRRRCPKAIYDDRLLSRSGQVALLGPSLAPEEHLVVATALLAKVIRARSG